MQQSIEKKIINANQIKAKANSKKQTIWILKLEGDIFSPLVQANQSYDASIL